MPPFANHVLLHYVIGCWNSVVVTEFVFVAVVYFSVSALLGWGRNGEKSPALRSSASIHQVINRWLVVSFIVSKYPVCWRVLLMDNDGSETEVVTFEELTFSFFEQRISCCGWAILCPVCHCWPGHTREQQDCGQSAGPCAWRYP